MIDVHVHVAIGRAAIVVRAKHAALDGGANGGYHSWGALLAGIADPKRRVAAGRSAIAADVGEGSTAIDVALNEAAQHLDICVAIHAACQIVGSP